ncbi:hypothetical protein LCGC14_2796940 [marine sediment metagenome]|uniref:Potassium channel domain-containing protein n=1 Tax=marine sediment metagenome TaxID=412755 RepID=A0A0F8YNT5_9ZZZZ
MDERSERIAKRFEVPILIAALPVIPAIVVQESSLGKPWTVLAAVLNWAIWAAFVTEVIVMLAVVPEKTRWLRRHPLEVAIVALTAPLLPMSLQVLRALRAVLVLVRVVRLSKNVFSIEGLGYAALLVLLTVLGGGALYAAVEPATTTWDGVWWAIVTIATVGYGDVAPRTDEGRAVAIVVMVVGVGFVAMLTGAVAQLFIARAGIGLGEPEVGDGEAHPGSVDAELLRELREITARLSRLESRFGGGPSPP